ncbi:beta-galactoside-binding lectin-like [Leucoraja erinacea]|uniref:beta-galactoside-binding lectin-like n=1 Tax=Leucoraja erinaceus TaxID=7782 RepID=UPI0024544289|nr:beta-galactoside-binding lectin-like [Leucoraja erinacea]
MQNTERRISLFHLTGLKIKHGDSVEVEGRVKSDTARFAIELGVDAANVAIHFNPRFSDSGSKIVLNNLINSHWQTQQIEENPLVKEEDFTVLITFNADNFEIVVCNKTTLQFPNHSEKDMLEEFWINGDIQVKRVTINSLIN